MNCNWLSHLLKYVFLGPIRPICPIMSDLVFSHTLLGGIRGIFSFIFHNHKNCFEGILVFKEVLVLLDPVAEVVLLTLDRNLRTKAKITGIPAFTQEVYLPKYIFFKRIFRAGFLKPALIFVPRGFSN